MLDPGDRHLLTDALRPPTGATVDAALATTYTVDLHTVLLAPLAMAAYDHTDGEVDKAAPVALLESVRRHAGHTTVLCQAGGVHVPGNYPRLAAFAEGMVAEVEPPEGRTFHPKIWVLRFRHDDGGLQHRFVCLSRNLTGDRSWDTVLVCDEDREAQHTFDAAPVAGWVTEVMASLVRPLPDERRRGVDDLCASFAATRLAVPPPFTAAQPVPLGFDSTGWPLPARADGWAVISPFLEASALSRLPESTGKRILLSRPESLDRVGARAVGEAETVVLQPMADLSPPEEEPADGASDPDTDDATDAAEARRGGVPRGLHAKVFVWDDGDTSHVLTGSANCTGAAFGGNIEMSVLLSGPTSSCGVDALLGDDKSGLFRITQPHQITNQEPLPDPEYTLERRIEAWHVALATARPVLDVGESADDFELGLHWDLPDDPYGFAPKTTVKPLVVKHARDLPLTSDALSWVGVALHALTPYLLVTTNAESEGVTVERSCVLVCEMAGVPEDRQRRLLRDLLANQQDVLRYLMLLLGDIGAEELIDRLADETDDAQARHGGRFGGGFDDLVLLEPLLRASSRGDDALERAQRLLEDLRDDDGDLPHLDDDFKEMWRVVWEGTRA